MDPTFPFAPVLNITFAVLVLLLLPWRFNTWSTAIRVYIVWLALLCMCRGINSIIWKDNTEDVAPVWCDIVTRILIAGSVSIPSCSFAIVRRLYYATCTGKVATTRTEKRGEVIIDLLLTVAFPLIIVALAYIVQGHRYDIHEEIGCQMAFVNTALWYVIVLMWPLVFGFMSAIYAALIIRTFITQHKELNEVLTNQSSKVNYSRFYRAFAVTSVDTLLTMPLSILVIYIDAGIMGPVIPWPGWAWVHYNFSRVGKQPAFIWRDPRFYHNFPFNIGWVRFYYVWNQWIYVFCTFVFIAIYGTSGEVVRYYTNVLRTAARFVGLSRGGQEPTKRNSGEPSTMMFQSVPAERVGTIVTWDTPSMMRDTNPSHLSLENQEDSSQAEDEETSSIKVTATHEEYVHKSKESVGEMKIPASVGDSNV